MNIENKKTSHITAVLQALFVTFLWSTSWVLIKIGLNANIPALTFAGLRYTLAFLCLLPLIVLNRAHLQTVKNLSSKNWLALLGLGVIFYTITQGAQFVSLSFLSAATLSLLLNLTTITVAFYSIFNKHETTSIIQWGGILLSFTGVLIYFFPLSFDTIQIFGLIAGLIGLLANAVSSIYGRAINTKSQINPLIVTFISMGIGGILLLLTGTFTQGFGTLNTNQWLIIGWLALVNTAFAFTLWNKTLQTLTAVESSIINGTMLPQIAILAWIFLQEALNLKQIIGISLVLVGTFIVQLWRYFPSLKIKRSQN
jgi:drug/metabolite transporter (DMT)-like permease